MKKGARITLGIVAGLTTIGVAGVGALSYLNRPLSQDEVDAAVQQRLEQTAANSAGVSAAVFATYSLERGTLRQYAAGTLGAASSTSAQAAAEPPTELDPNTPFHAASVGKTMLAAIFGQLVDEGRVSFDDRIADALDPAQLEGLFLIGGVDHSGEVTYEQLLSHTSGVADYFAGPVTSGATMIESISADPGQLFTPSSLLEFSRTRQNPTAEPGRRFSYSDTGYVLLGLAIEKIEGKAYADVLEARVFTPLEMHDSALFISPESSPRLMPLDVNGTDLSESNALTVDWAGGGVVSTTSDLAAFLSAFVSGQLVSDATLERLTDFAHEFDSGIGYGMGVMQFRFSELSPLLFSMSDAHGAVGATGSYALYDETNQMIYVANYGSLEFSQKAIEELVQLRLIVERLSR